MKRYITLIFSFIPFTLFAAENEKYLDISAGTWYLNWKQNDEADKSIIKEPINHKFEIKNSFAKELSLSGQWKYVKASIQYITSEGDKVASKKSKADKLLTKLGLKYKDYMDTVFTYIKTSIEGNAEGFDTKTGNTSYIEFNTDLTLLNLTFYPGWIFNKYIGFGSEYIKYKLPQSFYITSNGKTIYRGVESQTKWEANFLTLELTNINNIKNEKGGNFYFYLTGGYSFNVDVKGETAIDPSGYGKYLKGKKGYFYRGDIGFRYNLKKLFAFSLGYRYSEYVLETEKPSDNSINIYMKAKSKFEGPYVKLHIMF